MKDYAVKTVAYFKVAMEHKPTKSDVEDEAYMATDRMFDKESGFKVIDSKMTGYKDEKHLTIADVEFWLWVYVNAHNDELAMEEAEKSLSEIKYPVGVSLYEKEAYEVWNDYRYEGLA